MELYELARAAGGAIDPDVIKILVDLLKMDVAPLAVFQMLRSLCAGQRLAKEPADAGGPCLCPRPAYQKPEGETKEVPPVVEPQPWRRESIRECQQPSASRLPKEGGPGKSPTRGSTFYHYP